VVSTSIVDQFVADRDEIVVASAHDLMPIRVVNWEVLVCAVEGVNGGH
jgi:hypothetical protein